MSALLSFLSSSLSSASCVFLYSCTVSQPPSEVSATIISLFLSSIKSIPSLNACRAFFTSGGFFSSKDCASSTRLATSILWWYWNLFPFFLKVCSDFLNLLFIWLCNAWFSSLNSCLISLNRPSK